LNGKVRDNASDMTVESKEWKHGPINSSSPKGFSRSLDRALGSLALQFASIQI
jgi:hypothetical protein